MKKQIAIALMLAGMIGCKDAPSTLERNENKIVAPDQFKPTKKKAARESISEVAYQLKFRNQQVLDNPNDRKSHQILATYYKRMGKNIEAATHLEAANRVEALNENDMLMLAQLYAQTNKLRNALGIYQRFLKKYPDSWKVKNDIANIYRKQKQYSKALQIVEALIKERKDNIFAMHTLANIYLDQGRYDLAELTLHRARKLNPKNAETYHQLGLVYAKKDFRDESQTAYLAATQRNPQLLEPKLTLAQTFIDHYDFNNAVKLYRDILEIEPLQLTAHYHLGVSSAALGLEDEAQEYFLNVLRLDPTNKDIMLALGIFYQYHVQDGPKAVKYYQRFIKLNPGLSSKHEVYKHLTFAKKMPPKNPPVVKPSPAAKPEKKKSKTTNKEKKK